MKILSNNDVQARAGVLAPKHNGGKFTCFVCKQEIPLHPLKPKTIANNDTLVFVCWMCDHRHQDCQVIVGNIGTVLVTKDPVEAARTFENYVHISKTGEYSQRAYNEQVSFLLGDDIVAEYIPENPHGR